MPARQERNAGAPSGPPRFDAAEAARAGATGAIAGALALALFTAIGGIAHSVFGVPLW